MLNLLAYALLQVALLFGTPTSDPSSSVSATAASAVTTPPAPTTPPTTRIGNEGWDND